MTKEQFRALVIISLILFKGFCMYMACQLLTMSHPIWAFALFFVTLSSVNISYGKGEE